MVGKVCAGVLSGSGSVAKERWAVWPVALRDAEKAEQIAAESDSDIAVLEKIAVADWVEKVADY